MIYALDSNIISYMLKGDADVQKSFNDIINANNLYSIPPLVYYEVKRGLTVKKATAKLKEFATLYQDCIKGDMTIDVWEKAIELYVRMRLQGNLIDDADLFIASYCIVNGYTLVSNNTSHFARIGELKLVNWK